MKQVFYLKLAIVTLFLACFACIPAKSEKSGIVIANSDKYEATIFKQNCAICHGVEAYGKTVNGVFVPALRFGEPAKRSEEEVYHQIAFGKLPMPSFKGQLTESEMRKMAAFIVRDIQGRDPVSEKNSK